MFDFFKPTKEKAEAKLRQAMQTGNIEPAVAYYAKYIEAHPNDFEAHNDLGWMFLETGRPERAAEHFQKANELDERAVHWNNLGRALLVLERFEEADQAFETAAAMDPDDPEPAYNRTVSLRQQDRMEASKEALAQHIADFEEFAPALNDYAMILREDDQDAEALEYLERAVEARPHWPPALMNASTTLCDLGRYPEATQYLEALSDLGADIIVDVSDEEVTIELNGGLLYQGELKEGVPGFGE